MIHSWIKALSANGELSQMGFMHGLDCHPVLGPPWEGLHFSLKGRRRRSPKLLAGPSVIQHCCPVTIPASPVIHHGWWDCAEWHPHSLCCAFHFHCSFLSYGLFLFSFLRSLSLFPALSSFLLFALTVSHRRAPLLCLLFSRRPLHCLRNHHKVYSNSCCHRLTWIYLAIMFPPLYTLHAQAVLKDSCIRTPQAVQWHTYFTSRAINVHWI